MRMLTLVLIVLACGNAQAQTVEVVIRVLAAGTPVKSEIFSKEPGKKEDWFRDTSESGEVRLANHTCAAGQVFQARPKLPGYMFNISEWKDCKPGVIPFQFQRVIYAENLEQLVTTTASLSPTDEKTKRIREVFLKSYASGNFVALAAASAEMQKKFAELGQMETADLYGVMTLESIQRAAGKAGPLQLDPQSRKYTLPQELSGKFQWKGSGQMQMIESAEIKSWANEVGQTFSVPDVLLQPN